MSDTIPTDVTAQVFSAQEPWVLFKLNKQTYGVPAHITQEMISIPEVTPVPRAPEAVRGVINLRGSVIALIDLRIKLNQPSLVQQLTELTDMLAQREKEHVEWVEALARYVHSGEPFTLSRDPHECAFGRWYDNYHTDNPQLVGVLLRFDAPHKALHAAANSITALLNNGDKNGAEAALEALRGGALVKMQDLFAELIRNLTLTSKQEIAVVVEQENSVIAITVDAVDAVESLQMGSVEDLPGKTDLENNLIVNMLGRRSSNGDPVLIPDLGKIIRESTDHMKYINSGPRQDDEETLDG